MTDEQPDETETDAPELRQPDESVEDLELDALQADDVRGGEALQYKRGWPRKFGAA